MAAPLLSLAAVEAGYDRRPVLLGASLEVAAGEVVALLGPNGAGKSTVLKAAFGLVPVSSGRIAYEGRDITGRAPAANLHDGLAYLPQGGQVFAPLTVAENLSVAADLLPDPARARERVAAALERYPVLGERRSTRAGALSGGQKQMLAIAMALLGEPRLLLVDEPSIGLAPQAAREALARIAALRDATGAGVLLVEQNVALALDLADRAVLLLNGTVAAAAPTAAIRGDEALRRQFTFGLERAER